MQEKRCSIANAPQHRPALSTTALTFEPIHRCFASALQRSRLVAAEEIERSLLLRQQRRHHVPRFLPRTSQKAPSVTHLKDLAGREERSASRRSHVSIAAGLFASSTMLISLRPSKFIPDEFVAAARLLPPYLPRRAASIVAMSIFFMVIIASKARLAAARSGSETASIKARGVICHDRPNLSLHQPHSLSAPPLPTIAFHRRSVSAWSAV